MAFKSAAHKAKKHNSVKPHERASQPRTLSGKFVSNAGQAPTIYSDSFTGTNQQVSNVIDFVLVKGLVNISDTTYDDKLAGAMALYTC